MIPISPAKFIFMPNIYRAKVIFETRLGMLVTCRSLLTPNGYPLYPVGQYNFVRKTISGQVVVCIFCHSTSQFFISGSSAIGGGSAVVVGALQEWETKHAWLIATYMHFGKWKLPIPKIHIAPPFMLTRKVHNANKTLIIMPHVRTNNCRLLGYSSIFPDLKKSPGTTYHQCFCLVTNGYPST